MRASNPVGRNDLCPCGSGKKYKRCCLATASVGVATGPTPSALASVEAALADPTAAIHTVTGELFQPTRVTYDIVDGAALRAALRRLRCVQDDPAERRSVWLWSDEAREVTFDVPYERLPASVHPIVLANLRVRDADRWVIDLRSPQRALAAMRFFHRRLPAGIVRSSTIRITNRLYPVSELGRFGRSLDPYLDRDAGPAISSAGAAAKIAEAILGVKSNRTRALRGLEALESLAKQPLPELEDLLVDDDDADSSFVAAELALKLRSKLASEHWKGNTGLTLFELVQQTARAAAR